MNESSPNPPPIPPTTPSTLPASPGAAPSLQAAPSVASTLAIGEHPDDRTAVDGFASAVDAMLRHPRRLMYQFRNGQPNGLIAGLLVVALVCGAIYGLVVGSFSGGTQYWAAPLKIVAGLFLSVLICLPSLYIFSCLSGSDARLAEVTGLVIGLMALMTVLLIGFAPVAWVFSQSTTSATVMGALHLGFWAVATYFGVRFLTRGLSHQHGSPAALRLWTAVFLLVMLQMTTALRPLIGSADQLLPTEKKFFLNHWFDQLDAERPAVRK